MKKIIQILFIISALIISGCSDLLDRPPVQKGRDNTFWNSEIAVRVFANGFYSHYFVGYNSGWGVDYTPLRGYYFCDDFTSAGKQAGFETQAPESRSSVSESTSGQWLQQYSGPNWNFAWVRKSNLLLDRVEGMKDVYLSDEAYKHWSAVARFFRGYEYSRLVSVFGDIPYYDSPVTEAELDRLYKDRENRTIAMDAVYDDFKYVMANMRTSDGDVQLLNKYIAASFISRFMLFEGTWQKYHLNNNEKAKKYLEFATEAAEYVMSSNNYAFDTDFRSLFGTIGSGLASSKEVIMYRHYDATLSVTHHVASYSNGTESQTPAPNLDLAKAFICSDGQPYQTSTLLNADKLDLQNMIATRDPRFEATFLDTLVSSSATLLYATKFIDRTGPTFIGKTYPPQYGSSTNTNDAPVIRYAEVVLNWIEAKAELATMGGTAVIQDDIDKSVNAIRLRPLDIIATSKGIQKTAPLNIASIPNDPDRDADVSPLLWEIRRERRMEFIYEHTRLLDIKRWKKIDYMNTSANTDLLRGLWINFPVELRSWFYDKDGNSLEPVESRVGKLRVENASGQIITYDGTNSSALVGYYIPENIQDRDPFTDRVYMAPVGRTQISEYDAKGYTLTQTSGWGN